MRILITGAAGFLGSHLSDCLISEGHEVIGLDNFITGNRENIAHLLGNEKFSFRKHDVSNYIFIPDKVDAVLHFASPASPNPESPSGYFNLPIQTMKAGALGTHNCLGVARADKAKFLLASTSEIYGDPLVHPQTENYAGDVDPVGPRAVYDEAKSFAETINQIVGNKAVIVFVKDARSVRDPQKRQPDITRAREILGWEPKISLEEGIHRTIPYFKQKLGLA